MLAQPGRGVVEEGFCGTGLARGPVGSGPNGGAEGAADGEVPGLGLSEGLRGTQISAGRQRSRPEGSGGVGGEGEGSPSSGAQGWQEAGFLLDWSHGAAVAGDVVEDVANGVVAADAVSAEWAN